MARGWTRQPCALVLLALPALAQEPALEPALEPVTPAGYPIHGALRLRERSRWRMGGDDHDLYASLDLDGGDATRHAWTWRLSAQGIQDLDGAGDPSSPFFSLQDAQGSGLRGYLYEAYAEHHGSGTFESVRLGRQTDALTPVFLWYDGVHAQTSELTSGGLRLGGYAGRTVHTYETSSSGDQVFGAWSELHPWTHALLRLDWVHLEDEERLGNGSNDLTQLALGQALGERARFDVTWSRLDDENRDADLRVQWADSEQDLLVTASYHRLLEPQSTLALELDPFTEALLQLEPYWEARASASKGVGKWLRLDAGFDLRRLEDQADEGTFNHEFERAYLSAFLTKLPLDLELSLTGEVWDAGNDDFQTWGADLAKPLSEQSRVSVGTAYALYKFDLFQVSEREDVRTTYVRWRFKRTEGWGWDLGYEYEDDPGQDLQVLRMGATWRF